MDRPQGMEVNPVNYQYAQEHGPIPPPKLAGFTEVRGTEAPSGHTSSHCPPPKLPLLPSLAARGGPPSSAAPAPRTRRDGGEERLTLARTLAVWAQDCMPEDPKVLAAMGAAQSQLQKNHSFMSPSSYQPDHSSEPGRGTDASRARGASRQACQHPAAQHGQGDLMLAPHQPAHPAASVCATACTRWGGRRVGQGPGPAQEARLWQGVHLHRGRAQGALLQQGECGMAPQWCFASPPVRTRGGQRRKACPAQPQRAVRPSFG